MIENIQSICVNTAYACAAGVGTAVVAYVVARGAKVVSGGVKCVTAGALAGALIIGGMVVTNTRYAAAKTNDTQQVGGDLSNTNDVGQLEGGTNVVNQVGGDDSGTNAPPNLLGQPLLGLHLGNPPPAITFVTDEDISNQWRVVSVSSNTLNASVFTYPVTSVSFEQSPAIWVEALANGAGYGSWRIPFGGWRFTFGEVVWTNAFLWCEGYFRSAFANRSNEIQLLNECLTLCPQVNWSRYNLVASRAWAATNDVGGLVATFEGAAINDDPSKIVNAQFELFPQDGHIALRYDLRTVGDALYPMGEVVTSATGSRTIRYSDQFCQLLNHYDGGDCIEMYFIGDLSDRTIHGYKTDYGVIITKKATERTVAHELGHVLGWDDCYNMTDRLILDRVLSPLGDDCFLPIPQDWGQEKGRGFYEVGDTLNNAISSILMFGYIGKTNYDIPYGTLHGLRSRYEFLPGHIAVGAGFIRSRIQEFYSR